MRIAMCDSRRRDVISEIIKPFTNAGKDYRHFLSYYRGHDRKRIHRDGRETPMDEEIDLTDSRVDRTCPDLKVT